MCTSRCLGVSSVLLATVVAAAHGATDASDLAVGVQAYRAAIDGLVVRYSVTPTQVTEYTYLDQHCRLSRSGESLLLEREFRLPSANGTPFTGRIVSGFDGIVATQWNQREALAWHTSAIDDIREVRLHCSGYADLLRWFGPDDGPGSHAVGDLLRDLQTQEVTVLPETEEVGGRTCHVVKFLPSDGLACTIWLDTEFPGLPMKQVRDDPNGNPLVTYTVDALVSIGGILLPSRGTYTLAPIPGAAESVNGRVDQIEVLPDPAGPDMLAIKIGETFTDGYFQCSELITPGSWIRDDDAQTIQVTRRAELDAEVARTAALAARDFGDRSVVRASIPSDASRTGSWMLGVVVVLAAVAGFALTGRLTRGAPRKN